jgi:hypothetical protein
MGAATYRLPFSLEGRSEHCHRLAEGAAIDFSASTLKTDMPLTLSDIDAVHAAL